MSTKIKSLSTSRKSTKVNAKELNSVVSSAAGVVAPAGAGVGSGASAPAVAAVAVGVSGGASGRASSGRSNYESQFSIINNEYEEEIKVSVLAGKIKKYFDTPEWAGAAALRAALDPLVENGTMTTEQYDKALAAAARAAGVVVPVCSLPRVLAVVRAHFISEFENVCGVSFASVRAFFAGGASFDVFSLRINLSCVTADSDFNEFVCCSPLAADASASSVIRAFLSVRFAGAFLAARAAAVAAARSNFFDSLADAFRAGSKLGVSVKEMQQYLEQISVSVPASDNKDRERLTRTLARQHRALSVVDLAIMVRCPAVSDVDTSGDFFVPLSAALPASTSAKVRKLWAKREKLVDSIRTINVILSRC